MYSTLLHLRGGAREGRFVDRFTDVAKVSDRRVALEEEGTVAVGASEIFDGFAGPNRIRVATRPRRVEVGVKRRARHVRARLEDRAERIPVRRT